MEVTFSKVKDELDRLVIPSWMESLGEAEKNRIVAFYLGGIPNSVGIPDIDLGIIWLEAKQALDGQDSYSYLCGELERYPKDKKPIVLIYRSARQDLIDRLLNRFPSLSVVVKDKRVSLGNTSGNVVEEFNIEEYLLRVDRYIVSGNRGSWVTATLPRSWGYGSGTEIRFSWTTPKTFLIDLYDVGRQAIGEEHEKLRRFSRNSGSSFEEGRTPDSGLNYILKSHHKVDISEALELVSVRAVSETRRALDLLKSFERKNG